jgi:hypothetical protein
VRREIAVTGIFTCYWEMVVSAGVILMLPAATHKPTSNSDAVIRNGMKKSHALRYFDLATG